MGQFATSQQLGLNQNNSRLSNQDVQNINNASKSSGGAQGYYQPQNVYGGNRLVNAGTTNAQGAPVNSFANNMKAIGIQNVPIPPPPPGGTGQTDWSKTPGGVSFGGGYKEPGWTPPPEWRGLDTSSLPPLMNSDGSDTEFGYLIKLGANQPGNFNYKRYQQILNEWRAAHPVAPPPPTLTPVVSPAPVLPERMTGTPPSPGGAVSPVSTTTPGGGGMSGKPAPVDNFVTSALKGLQGVGSVASNIVPTMPIAQISKGIADLPKIITDLWNNTSQPTTQTQQNRPKGLTGDPIHMGEGGWLNEKLGGIPLPDIGTSELLQNIRETPLGQMIWPTYKPDIGTREISGGSRNFPNLEKEYLTPYGGGMVPASDIGSLYKTGTTKETSDVLGTSTKKGQFQMGTPNLTPQGGVQYTNMPGASASQRNLGTTLEKPQQEILANAVVNGLESVQNATPALASHDALPIIDKALNQAIKNNDIPAVRRALDLKEAVTDQINMIVNIGRIVSQLTSGFGSPQSREISEARQPLVEQGIGQALTSVPQAPSYQGGGGGAQIQRLPFRLPEAEPVQRNRPLLYPYSEGGM